MLKKMMWNEVGEQMLMSHCGWGGLVVGDDGAEVILEGTRALLPCQNHPEFSLKGVPSWGCV